MDMEDINDKIMYYSRQLHLPGFRKYYQSLQTEMPADNIDYDGYLVKLMELEYLERKERRKKLRIKLAGFPQLKYLQELSLDDLPQDAQEKLPSLKSMDFIENGQNIILSGNPGTGKSHLATGLGLEACEKGYKVYFVTVPQLITQVRESRSERLPIRHPAAMKRRCPGRRGSSGSDIPQIDAATGNSNAGRASARTNS